MALVLVVAAACAPVRPHLRLPPMEIGTPAFVRTLEAHTGTPFVAGNDVRILLNGDEIFPAELAAIRAARTTITYAQYYYDGGATGRAFAQALAERCRAGVDVRILLDAFGAILMPAESAELLTAAGCRITHFRPLADVTSGRVNHRNHRRVLVVDGRIAFTGGSGVSDKWTGDGRTAGHWRETDVRVEGPVVQYLQGAFSESWLEATGTVIGGELYFPIIPHAGDVRAHVVTSSPAKGDFAMYTTFLLAMASAQRSILITNPYFVPDERMTDALLRAVARGVRVAVLVPGEIDHNVVRLASRRGFGDLLRGGIEIYEYTAALLHAKTMVVDGLWATIGSTNLDNRSFAINAELNLVTYDHGVAERLERVFAEDLRHARRVDLARWRARPFWQRFLELMVVPLRDQM